MLLIMNFNFSRSLRDNIITRNNHFRLHDVFYDTTGLKWSELLVDTHRKPLVYTMAPASQSRGGVNLVVYEFDDHLLNATFGSSLQRLVYRHLHSISAAISNIIRIVTVLLQLLQLYISATIIVTAKVTNLFLSLSALVT